MKKCIHCNALNDENNQFCEICGKELTAGDTEVLNEQPQPQPQPQYQTSAQTPPPPQYTAAPPVQPAQSYSPYNQPPMGMPVNEAFLPPEYKPVSMGTYIGYMFLFSIPIVGLVMMIITALNSSASKSLRNFAKAYLIIFAISAVFAIIGIIALSMLIASGLLAEPYYY